MIILTFLILLWQYGILAYPRPVASSLHVAGVPQYVIDYGKYIISPLDMVMLC
jgi:hypothetical protein